jgi:hypothetical protein
MAWEVRHSPKGLGGELYPWIICDKKSQTAICRTVSQQTGELIRHYLDGIPRLSEEAIQDLKIAYLDHDDERDEQLAMIIEWYLRTIGR